MSQNKVREQVKAEKSTPGTTCCMHCSRLRYYIECQANKLEDLSKRLQQLENHHSKNTLDKRTKLDEELHHTGGHTVGTGVFDSRGKERHMKVFDDVYSIW